jgi:hypothetical protein
MYRKKNLYMFDQMVEALGTSRTITIHPAVSEDFLDYGKLFDFFYKKLTGRIKQNHIFTAFGLQGYEMKFRQSDLHEEYIVHIGKKGFKDMTFQDMIDHGEDQLMQIECEGLNPYKAYELFKNFRPYVPVECQSDPMYTKPSPEVLAKVKAKKLDRKVFREELKKKKYGDKKQLEDDVFGDGDGSDGGAGDGADEDDGADGAADGDVM